MPEFKVPFRVALRGELWTAQGGQMRFVVSGTRPHSTIVDELDIDALDESDAARKFRDETGTLPDLVETIEGGEVVKARDIDGWCVDCDGSVFRDQEWLRPTEEPERMCHAYTDDCPGFREEAE